MVFKFYNMPRSSQQFAIEQNKRGHKSHFRQNESQFEMFVVLSPQSFFECEPGRFGRIICLLFHVISTLTHCRSSNHFLPPYIATLSQPRNSACRSHPEIVCCSHLPTVISVFNTLFTATGRICTDPGVRFVPFVFNLNSDLRNRLQQSCCAIACHSCH